VKLVFHSTDPRYLATLGVEFGESATPPLQGQTPFQWYLVAGKLVADTLASYVLNNLFGRFPGLTVVALECGINWVVPLLHDVDHAAHMGRKGHWPGGEVLGRPSEVLLEHLYISPFFEEDVGAATGEYKWATASFNTVDEDFVSTGHRRAARDLYDRAGLGPEDVDVALIYEGFTSSVIMSLEDWGFCKIGEGGPLVAEGAHLREGRIPVNTHGGNLAEVYLQGITHVLEGVRQLRGTAVNQLPDAEVALYASGVGASPGGGILLRRW